MLAYEGAIKFINISLKNLDNGELEKVHFNSLKAQAIIYELMTSLNMERGGEIAKNLFNIYDYINYRLVIGNAMKKKEHFEEARVLLGDLKGAWAEARKKVSEEAGELANGRK